MDDKRATEQFEEELPEKRSFIAWVKKNKVPLLFVGVSVTALVATILGLKNKESILKQWNSLKKEIEKGSLYSAKWFEKASIEELQEARKIVQQDYRNPKLDTDYRNECWNLLTRFDNVIGTRQWQGQERGFPVHNENGWYLPSDD